jgi:DNA-directed RNA polymerase specialized sigma24 family protein
VSDQVHPHQELDPREAERLSEDPNREAKEKAFRLTVARLWAYEALDTKEIAARMNVDEARVYNVLQRALEMIRR